MECWKFPSQEHGTFFRLIPLTFLYLAIKFNSSSSFQIPGFSALQSDRTHSRSGIITRVATHASGRAIIFITQGLSFSELSISSLSSLNHYSDYVRVNISLNNSYSLPFLNVYAPPIRSSLMDSRTDSFPLQISLHSGRLQLPSHPLGLKKYFRHPWGGSIRLCHFF